MKNFKLNLRWLHGSPNQTGETLTRENRLGIVTCLNPMRTLLITLLLLTLGVGQMWAWWFVPGDIQSAGWSAKEASSGGVAQMDGSNKITFYNVPKGTYDFKLIKGSTWGNGNFVNNSDDYIKSICSNCHEGNNQIELKSACDLTFEITNEDTWWCNVSASAPTYYIKYNWNNSGWGWSGSLTSNGGNLYSCTGQYGGSGSYDHTRLSSTDQDGTNTTATVNNSPSTGDKCVFVYNSSTNALTITRCNKVTTTNKIYFDNSKTQFTGNLYLVIGHDKPTAYSKVYALTQKAGTQLYYLSNSSDTWDDATYYAIIASSSSVSSGDWGSSSLSTKGNNGYTAAYTGKYDLGNDRYLITTAGASNGTSITITAKSSGYSALNYTQSATLCTKAYGASSYSANTSSLTSLNITTYYLTGENAISTLQTYDMNGSTGVASGSACQAATTTINVGDAPASWVYDGIFTSMTGSGSAVSTDQEFTYYPTAATNYYVRFHEVHDPSVSLAASSAYLTTTGGLRALKDEVITLTATATYTAGSPVRYTYEYSTNGGSTWNSIASSVTSTSQTYTPTTTGDYKFRVTLPDETGTPSAITNVHVTKMYTINVKKNSSWTPNKLYIWNKSSERTQYGAFPGATGKFTNRGQWYSFELNSDFDSFIISASEHTSNHTTDVNNVTSDGCYTINAGTGTSVGVTSATCPSAPSVTTTAAPSSLTNTSATLEGNISSNGNDNITDYGFYWGTTEACGTKAQVGTTNKTGDISKSITITAGTTYYFKAYATNGQGTTYGGVKSFKAPYKVTITQPAGCGSMSPTGAQYTSTDIDITASAATGYTWTSWDVTNGTKESETATFLRFTPTADNATVTATYTPADYVVTLDKNTGSTDGSVTATYNSTAIKDFTAVTKTGYDCIGYWTEASGGYKVVNTDGTLVSYSSEVSAYLNDNGTWKKTDATKLYAQWTPKTYTITLDDNGEYQGNGSATATYDGVLSGITHARRTGYHIDGYYKEAGLTNRITEANGTLCASTAYTNASSKWTNDGAVSLFAKWTANTYSVAFDPNDEPYAGDPATGTMSDEDFTYDVSKALTANGFSREGYTFAGWATTPTGDVEHTDGKTVSNLTAEDEGTVTLYAKWTGKTYTVTFNARGGTGLSASNTTVTMGSAYSAGTGLSGSLPTLTAPDGFVFDAWYTAAEGGTKVDDETLVATPGDHTLYAHYIHQTRVYFKNTLGWSDVYVTYDATWNNDRGAGNNGKTYHKMTLLDAENKIYVDVIPEDVIRSWKYNIAFNDRQLGSMPTGNHESWNSGNAVFRRDFDSYATMFVPCPTKSYDKNSVAYYSTDQWVDLNDKEEAINYRYKNGYWICYNDTKSGYTIKGSWDGWANDSYLEASQAGSSTFFMKKQLAANTTYQFLLYKHCKTTNTYSSTFTNTGTMTDANCSNWTFTTENAAPGSTTNAKITTKAAGEYTFKVEYTDDGQIKMSVVYPFAVNDYRVVYNWNDGSAHTHSSEIIRAAAGTNETISVFVHKAESPIVSRSLKIQQCTAINGSGVPTWTDRNTIDLSSISENGVYNFVITQPASGYATGAYLEPYKGDYYIRTASADGGWDFYKEYTDNKMTLSEYSMTQTLSDPYSHYYCRYIVSTSVDITYTIATDYSPSISDTLIGDATIGGLANKTLPASANVRFTWNQETNAVKRSYLKSAQGGDNTRYLVLHGSDSKVLDKNGTAIAENVGKSMAANELLFDDLGNWTYQVNLKAQPGAAVSLIANYNGADRYLVGGADTWETIISGSSSTPYNIVAVYDFKTNRLMTAWTPEGDITEDLSNVDILLIRYQQEAGTAITFGSGGSKVSSQSVIGAIRFDYNDMVGKVANWTAASRAYLKYFISFPFDVNVSDIFGLNSAYGDAYVIEEYDGKSRAEKGSSVVTELFLSGKR